jgi:hypothetical protein
MRKRSRIQHQKQKARVLSNGLSSISWQWMPIMLAFAVIAMVVGIWVIGHNSQTSTSNTAKTSIAPEVTTTSHALLLHGATNSSQPTTGVFSLSAGGPIPIPANVLRPTNIARIVRKNEITTIYAGSLVQTPTTGVLAVLQENLTTGQQSLHLYRTTKPAHALTILSIHQNIVAFSSPTAKGMFNLDSHQFQFL